MRLKGSSPARPPTTTDSAYESVSRPASHSVSSFTTDGVIRKMISCRTAPCIFAPNAFTPNGDGTNDVFAPVVKGARIYELGLFDRYGKELFRSRETDATWDGGDLPQGIYTYTVHIAEYGTHRQEYTGHITLLR